MYSVEKACGNIDAEIFVVDNASSDGSKEYFTARFPEVKFIWLEKNLGFGRANNTALTRTTGEFVLFLNPDTIVAEDTFERSLAFARRQNKFGSMGIRMVDGSGNYLPESKRMFPSMLASFYKMSGISALFPRSPYFSKYYAAHVDEQQSGEVDVLAGAFMMVSKIVLDITKGFDEDFFMYGEDIDLSYRINKAGFKNYYFGEAAIIHFKGESVRRGSPAYLKTFYGAMLLFVKKHSEKPRPQVKAAILAAYTLARWKQALIPERPGKQKMFEKNSLAIVAREDVFNRLLQIIKLSSPPFLISGRIGIEKSDTVHALGSVEEIKTVATNNKINHILLAEGELAFKKIIDIITANKNLANFLICAHNSKSIVGSSDKNRSGFYIAGPL